MPLPSAQYTARAGNASYDPATLSDDEDGTASSIASRTSSQLAADTTVLGYSDGLLPRTAPEMNDWRTSRIGGDPVFPPLSPAPSPSSALCAVCKERMPLLTQIYCPLDASALERVVYTFACPSKGCRGKEGSIRAWRANVLWAEEEEEVEQVVEQQEKEQGTNVQLGSLIFGGPSAAAVGAGAGVSTANPFASTINNPFATPSAANNPFASNPFAAPAAAPNPFAALAPSPPPPAASSPAPATSSPIPASSLTWPTIDTSYTPHWLTTAYEPAPPKSSSKSAAAAMAALSLSSSSTTHDASLNDPKGGAREGKGAGGRTKKGSGGGAGRAGGGAGASAGGAEQGWSKEGYEVQKVKGVDEVFLRFQERVEREGLQVVRYHHASIPLPYTSTSPAYRTLFPSPSADSDSPGIFNPSRIPSCTHCSLPSVFEYQLMPALVALLNRDAEKRRKLAGQGKSKSVMEEDGLDFATVWVFACVGECLEKDAEEGWREERVLVEWEE